MDSCSSDPELRNELKGLRACRRPATEQLLHTRAPSLRVNSVHLHHTGEAHESGGVGNSLHFRTLTPDPSSRLSLDPLPPRGQSSSDLKPVILWSFFILRERSCSLAQLPLFTLLFSGLSPRKRHRLFCWWGARGPPRGTGPSPAHPACGHAGAPLLQATRSCRHKQAWSQHLNF